MSRVDGSRRAKRSRRRVDAAAVVAVVLPVVVAGALSLTRPDQAQIASSAPSHAVLTSAEVICPGAPGSATLAVGSAAAPGSSGTVRINQDETVRVVSGRVQTRDAASSASVVVGTGAVAPGLVASLTTTDKVTAWDCTAPVGEQWFTGVGAGPTQSSIIELVNPNAGPAVADIDVLSDEGVLAVPTLRGVAVAGQSEIELDLGELVPRTGVLALHVSVVRGQVGVAVRDRGERLTGGISTEEWLAAQTTPTTSNLLLGVESGSGRHSLTVANPGEDEITATMSFVTAESTFVPEGIKPVTVPPHSVARVVLDDLLRSPAAADLLGLQVDTTAPAVASVRSVINGDLSFVVPGEQVSTPTAVVVPNVRSRLVLAGADRVGVAVVVGRDAQGREVARERIALTPKRGAAVDLPAAVRLIEVTPERTSVGGAVLLRGEGSAVLRLRTVPRSGEVPAVSFGP